MNKTSDQTLKVKTQNPLYYGTEGVVSRELVQIYSCLADIGEDE